MAPPTAKQSPTFQNYLDLCAEARRVAAEWIASRRGPKTANVATRWILEELAWYVTQRLKHPCYIVEVPTGHGYAPGGFGYTALPMPMVDEGPEEGWREEVVTLKKQPFEMTYDPTKVTVGVNVGRGQDATVLTQVNNMGDVIALVAQQHLEATERLTLEAIRREHGIQPRRRDLVADADIELTREEYTRRYDPLRPHPAESNNGDGTQGPYLGDPGRVDPGRGDR